MAGPKVPWRPGRIDGVEAQATPDGRLPDATQGADHLREHLRTHGASRPGNCRPSPVRTPLAAAIVTALDSKVLVIRANHRDQTTTLPSPLRREMGLEALEGPKQLEDKKTRSLMMLPTDYVLVQDKSFKKFAKQYADSQDLWFKECVD